MWHHVVDTGLSVVSCGWYWYRVVGTGISVVSCSWYWYKWYCVVGTGISVVSCIVLGDIEIHIVLQLLPTRTLRLLLIL